MTKKNIYILTTFILAFFISSMDIFAQSVKKKKKKYKKKYKHARTHHYRPAQDSTVWSAKLNFDTVCLNTNDSLMAICKSFIGLPYRYGGNDPRGFDCSGYVRYCYKRIGIDLPHHSGGQMQQGIKVDEKNAEPGDIIFFGHYNSKRRSMYISHSGIVYSNVNGKIYFIHSASSVGIRIDCLDQGWYKQRFRGIRRIL